MKKCDRLSKNESKIQSNQAWLSKDIDRCHSSKTYELFRFERVGHRSLDENHQYSFFFLRFFVVVLVFGTKTVGCLRMW